MEVMESEFLFKAVGFDNSADPDLKLGEVTMTTEGGSTQWEWTGVADWFYMVLYCDMKVCEEQGAIQLLKSS